MDLAISTGAQGLMWAILSLGVFLSFRILDVPDMTCEGSFPLGGYHGGGRSVSVAGHCGSSYRWHGGRRGYRYSVYKA